MKALLQICLATLIIILTLASSCIKQDSPFVEVDTYCVSPDSTSPMPDLATFEGERMAYCKVNGVHFHPIIDSVGKRQVEEKWDKGSDIYNDNFFSCNASYRKINGDVPTAIGIVFQQYLHNDCTPFRLIHFHFNAINIEKNVELRITNDYVISDSYNSRWFTLIRSKPYYIKVLDLDFNAQRIKGEFAFTAIGDHGEVWEVTDGIFDLPFYYE